MAPHPSPPRSPLADGLEWSAKIMACALLMVGPALAGGWLDSIWQTKFLFFVGMLLGLVLGGGALLALTKVNNSAGNKSSKIPQAPKTDELDQQEK